ncbi:glycosyltransferase [Bremerella sp.]|uniref:glycosyltransferase n=1 Tax=Bremerella sp. TaxID=2795602 RepID=UPI00391C023F
MSSLKILLSTSDLYGTVGGGQTFYRRLIEANPEHQFWYFCVNEKARAARPANAQVVRFDASVARQFIRDVDDRVWMFDAFAQSYNLANSIKRMKFDVIDIPDYMHAGALLRPALADLGVACDRIALSMHGSVSPAIPYSWTNPETREAERGVLESVEELQYRCVDTRYGISPAYLEHWKKQTGISGSFVDPLFCIGNPTPKVVASESSPPDLCFIGRFEKWKGPDTFIDLVWQLPRASYSRIRLVGVAPGDLQIGKQQIVEMAARRGLDIEINDQPGRDEIWDCFNRRSVVVLPSRWDTLNLVALESLLSGCPTVISKAAGVSSYLSSHHPEIPFLEMDPDKPYQCIPELNSLLNDYDNARRELVDSLEKAPPSVPCPSVSEIYSESVFVDQTAGQAMRERYEEIKGRYQKLLASPAFRAKSFAVRTAIQMLPKGTTRESLKRDVASATLKFAQRLRLPSLQAMSGFGKIRNIPRMLAMPEENPEQVESKLRAYQAAELIPMCARLRIWGDLARMERQLGNDLAAATYELRCMRILGDASEPMFRRTKAILEEHGCQREAEAMDAMYGPYSNEERTIRSLALLDRAYDEGFKSEPIEWQNLEDNRDSAVSPKVAVVVSMYCAESKLALFLQTLELQTMAQREEVEVILVDSGSPTKEYDVYRKYLSVGTKLKIVFGRSMQRETIQAAWNRGLQLAKAPYVCLLGVDEAIHPECLERLAGYLDENPSVTWVQANAIVTEVTPTGSLVNDLLFYDRTNYQQAHERLETCYLSWVGALQRRSLYESVGRYDASFRAAGDTEFKGRVLPRIKTAAYPETLGFFRNYPEARATENPRTEIEDLRAWYLHRTQAGVKYAFRDRPREEMLLALRHALGYRKSFRGHMSIDVDYAASLCRVLLEDRVSQPIEAICGDVFQLNEQLKRLDTTPARSLGSLMSQCARTALNISAIQRKHRRMKIGELLGDPEFVPSYFAWRDNRFEQHNSIWKTVDTSSSVSESRISDQRELDMRKSLSCT